MKLAPPLVWLGVPPLPPVRRFAVAAGLTPGAPGQARSHPLALLAAAATTTTTRGPARSKGKARPADAPTLARRPPPPPPPPNPVARFCAAVHAGSPASLGGTGAGVPLLLSTPEARAAPVSQ